MPVRQGYARKKEPIVALRKEKVPYVGLGWGSGGCWMNNDPMFMAAALEEARNAIREGNKPFGAAVVQDGQLIARGRNVVKSAHDPTAHGEVQAIRAACRELGTISLEGTTLYTTCEPCLMCTGAIIAAKIAKVVIGARWTDAPQYFDQSKPSLLSVGAQVRYPFSYTVGVMREECVKLYEGL